MADYSQPDIADDPLLPLQERLIPPGITGFTGRTGGTAGQSPGLWNGGQQDTGFGAYSNDMPSGVWSTIGRAIADPIKKFYGGPNKDYSSRPLEKNVYEPGSGSNDAPYPMSTNSKVASNVQEQPMGTSALPPLPQSEDQKLVASSAPKGDVWAGGAAPFQSSPTPTDMAASARAPDPTNQWPPVKVQTSPEGRQVGGPNIGVVPSGGEQGADPTKGAGLTDIFGNSVIGRALNSGFSQFNNWRNDNKMMLMAMAGGLAGPRSGIGRAFTAGAGVLPQQQQLGNQNATQNFLMSPQGGSMDANLARAVAGNSAMTQEVLGQLTGYAAPKIITTKDFLGQEHNQALQLNRQTGKWELNNIAGASGGSTTSGGGGGATSDQWASSTPEQRLQIVAQQYGPEAADAVKAMYEGRISPQNRLPGLVPLTARVYGEDFDQQKSIQRQKGWNYWYGGGDGTKAMRALDQVSQHFGDLPAAVEAQGNWGGIGTGLNAPTNYMAENFLGSTVQGPVRTTANAVTHELSGFWKPGHGSDADINKWAQDFPVNGSIPQQKKQVGALIDLIEGGAGANEDVRQEMMGGAAGRTAPVMNAATRNRLDALKEWANDPNAKWDDVAAKYKLPNGGKSAPTANVAPAAAQPAPGAPQQGVIVRQNGHLYQQMPDGSWKLVQ